MKVLIVIASDLPNERANAVQQMRTAAALVRQGHEVEVVAKQSTPMSAADVLNFYAVPASDAPRLDLIKVRPGEHRYREFFVRLLMHRSWWRAPLLLTRESRVVLLSRLTRPFRKVLFEAHDLGDLPGRARNRRGPRLHRTALRVANGVVTVTNAGAAKLRAAGVRSTELLVAPDAADVADGAPDAPPLRSPAHVVYVGSLYDDRGCDLVIQALPHVPDACLTVVGGPEDRLPALRQLAADCGVADRVTLRAPVPHREVIVVLRAADLLVLPMRAGLVGNVFASPMKLFEYMAACRPIVAADLPTLREIVDERHVFFFEPDDPLSLAATIVGASRAPAEAARRARCAFTLLASAYTYDARAKRIAEFARDRALTSHD